MKKTGIKIMSMALAGGLAVSVLPFGIPSTQNVYAAEIIYTASAVSYSEDNATIITFSENGVKASGIYSGYETEGTSVTITESGTYVFSGICTDGNIEVSKGLTDVTIVFDGLTLSSSTTAPFNAKSDTEVTIEVKAGSSNILSDVDRNEEKPKSCINSGGNLVICGTGSLTVNGNNKNGIKADGKLTVSEADITVKAADNGMAADNVLTVDGGTFDIDAGGAGIKSSPDEVTDDTQAVININGGTFDINSEGDAVHSDAYIYILGGNLVINSGDDGMHADTSLIIGKEGGSDSDLSIDVQSSYEGLEGGCVYIYAGTVNVVSSDDGINSAGGSSDASGTGADDAAGSLTGNRDDSFNSGGGFGKFGDQNGIHTGAGLGGNMSGVGDYYIYIYGGNISVNASGDGLDSNGSIYMYDGTVEIFQEGSGNSAIDYEVSCEVYGGTLLGAGASGMVATPTEADGTQPYLNFSVQNQVVKGSTFSIKNSSGTVVYSASAKKTVSSIIFSSKELVKGETYTLYVDNTQTASAEAVTESTGNGMGGGNRGDAAFPGNGTRPDGNITRPDGNGTDVGNPQTGSEFSDVSADSWYAAAVDFVSRTGIMNGVSESEFRPDDDMTRAMLVTVLWRLDGENKVSSQSSFSDVSSSLWYADAVNWAVENGIVTGYSDTVFGPNDSVTREQIAAILKRYAQYKGTDVSGEADISTYEDSSDISDWALSSVKWAVSEGIISGKTVTTIDPAGDATRAEVATMLMRQNTQSDIRI